MLILIMESNHLMSRSLVLQPLRTVGKCPGRWAVSTVQTNTSFHFINNDLKHGSCIMCMAILFVYELIWYVHSCDEMLKILCCNDYIYVWCLYEQYLCVLLSDSFLCIVCHSPDKETLFLYEHYFHEFLNYPFLKS